MNASIYEALKEEGSTLLGDQTFEKNLLGGGRAEEGEVV